MAELDTSGFTFTSVPTKEETEIFEYVGFDYIDENPGYPGGIFLSYVGIYFNEDGELSGIYEPNPNVPSF